MDKKALQQEINDLKDQKRDLEQKISTLQNDFDNMVKAETFKSISDFINYISNYESHHHNFKRYFEFMQYLPKSFFTKDVCELLVKVGINTISFLPHLDLDLLKVIVKANYRCLKYLNQSVELCLFALEQNSEAYTYVKIVPNNSYEETFNNLKKYQIITHHESL